MELQIEIQDGLIKLQVDYQPAERASYQVIGHSLGYPGCSSSWEVLSSSLKPAYTSELERLSRIYCDAHQTMNQCLSQLFHSEIEDAIKLKLRELRELTYEER